MVKKALQIGTTLAAFLAGYAGYVRVFALVAAWVGSDSGVPIVNNKLATQASPTALEATRLASQTFGADHWSADPNLPVRYYNSERGYFLYSQVFERLKEGQQIRFRPFALIWRSKDGKSLETATADEAVVDLDRPIGLNKPGDSGGPMHVVHAEVNGDVRLRDDKGTPGDPNDDLKIGPLTYLEFDEKDQVIKSTSHVLLVDRNSSVNGDKLRIELRPKDEPGATGSGPGFSGAKTVWLYEKIRIHLENVGKTGFLSGPNRTTARGEAPLDLACAGPMRIDLPKPRLRVVVGPPAPPDPTILTFQHEVVVHQGPPQPADRRTPEQDKTLKSDNLFLHLYPAEKPDRPAPEAATATAKAKAAPADPNAPSEGPLTDLSPRWAKATGHIVELHQGRQMRATGNELIWNKGERGQPDKTYFRSDPTTKVWAEKVELDEKGKIKAVDTFQVVDVTIFDDGTGNGPARVVARGPGRMEMRPDRGHAIERLATWDDELVMFPEGPGEDALRVVTLTGNPEVVDYVKGTRRIGDQDLLKFLLEPQPRPTRPEERFALELFGQDEALARLDRDPANRPKEPGASGDGVTGGSFRIKWLIARDQVRLSDSVQNLTMNAAQVLNTEFLPAPPAGASPPRRPKPDAGAAGPATAAAPAGAEPEKADDPPPLLDPSGLVAQIAKPAVAVDAVRIWAKVYQKDESKPPGTPDAPPTSAIQEARLRGQVAVRQEPAFGKARGLEAYGEAIDVNDQGHGLMRFQVNDREPGAARRPAAGVIVPPAQVITDEMTVNGPEISLDQATDFSQVQGKGQLVMLTEKGVLDGDSGDDAPASSTSTSGPGTPGRTGSVPIDAVGRIVDFYVRQFARQDPALRIPFTVEWTSRMTFEGRGSGSDGASSPARAHFFDGVRAHTEDSLISHCDDMVVDMDRPVSFARLTRGAQGGSAEGAGAKPQIARIHCRSADPNFPVLVVNRKRDPSGRFVLEQQRIKGPDIVYDRTTGWYQIDGAGLVRYYSREGQNEANGIAPMGGSTRAGQGSPRGRTTRARAAKLPEQRQIYLVRVQFQDEMEGRITLGERGQKSGYREANFHGDVQLIRGRVPNERTDLDPDLDMTPARAAATESVLLGARTLLRVISEPAPPGSGEAVRNWILATGDATAVTAYRVMRGEKIVYDSLTGVFHLFSAEGGQVVLQERAGPGQAPSASVGRALKYNMKTGEMEMIEPSTFEIVNKKTGYRIFPPGAPWKEPMKPRGGLRMPNMSDKERKGMSGH